MAIRFSLDTLGLHQGALRRMARGVRMESRPAPPYWGLDYYEPELALRLVCSVSAPPPAVEWVTWVPGHDGSPGPGFALAQALALHWRMPLVESLIRVHSVPSSHASPIRPSFNQSLRSLQVIGPPRNSLLLVDNVVATGNSMSSCMQALSLAGWSGAQAWSLSVDLAVLRSQESHVVEVRDTLSGRHWANRVPTAIPRDRGCHAA